MEALEWHSSGAGDAAHHEATAQCNICEMESSCWLSPAGCPEARTHCAYFPDVGGSAHPSICEMWWKKKDLGKGNRCDSPWIGTKAKWNYSSARDKKFLF